MSANKFGDKLQELDLSHEEIDRLTKCMKVSWSVYIGIVVYQRLTVED